MMVDDYAKFATETYFRQRRGLSAGEAAQTKSPVTLRLRGFKTLFLACICL